MAEFISFGETMMAFSPESPGSLKYKHNYSCKAAGAETNTLIGVQKLGHSTGWLSRLGKDGPGEFVLSQIQAEGVNTDHVQLDSCHATGIMLKQLRSHGETSIFYYRSGSAFCHASLSDAAYRFLSNARLFHFTGITPVLSEACKKELDKILVFCRAKKIPVSFDPNVRLKLWKNKDYRDLMKRYITLSDYVMLGAKEAGIIFGEASIEGFAAKIWNIAPSLSFLAIKNGAEGAYVYDKTDAHFIKPYPCTPIDPVGAGDAFNAGFLAGILEGQDLKTCGRIAAICGALATETVGDIEGLPGREELMYHLASSPLPPER